MRRLRRWADERLSTALAFPIEQVGCPSYEGLCRLPVASITAAKTTIPARMPDSRISAGNGAADR